VAANGFDFTKFGAAAIKACPPLMLRGFVGAMGSLEIMRFTPELAGTLLDEYIQMGATGGVGLSGLVMLAGVLIGHRESKP
jgi:hypothetical protein